MALQPMFGALATPAKLRLILKEDVPQTAIATVFAAFLQAIKSKAAADAGN